MRTEKGWSVEISPYNPSKSAIQEGEMDNLSGQYIKGYELGERLGAGGFGAVYLAHQSTVGREAAMKIILPRFANHPDFIRRFETEAQCFALLEHLHIVRVAVCVKPFSKTRLSLSLRR